MKLLLVTGSADSTRRIRVLLWLGAVIIYPNVLLILSGKGFSWRSFLVQSSFVLAVLLLAAAWQICSSKNGWLLASCAFVPLLFAALWYVFAQSTFSAWFLLAIGFSLLIHLDRRMEEGVGLLSSFVIRLFFAGWSGAAAGALLQLEERFSEEEFLAVLQAAALGVFWFLLAQTAHSALDDNSVLQVRSRGKKVFIGSCLLAALISGFIAITLAYQNSFYPNQAPAFKGITTEEPFLCSQQAPSAQTYNGERVHQQLIKLVAANPNKSSLEYGLLALAEPGASWSQEYRRSLLSEARQGLYAKPAHSLKYGQCLAARSAYFYGRVIKAYPELFSLAEQAEILSWFTAINQRAWSTEWVDWMYALAYRKWPSGPYENQDCGLGLLAMLEVNHLADPALSNRNRQYLAENPRGWLGGFRNTDDAYTYQPEWLQNAWFQQQYSEQNDPANLRRSFEWLLLQAKPDGSSLRYNFPISTATEHAAYWGANLFIQLQSMRSALIEPKQALWLAGRTADYLTDNNHFLNALPGLEQVFPENGQSPTWGSCLMYGDSGLPNQAGPLAPDKIVFRSSWESDSTYLLLNLRFTGWHRYKATNSIILLYKDSPILSEITSGDLIRWLPKGRQLLRDKRIPREYLNGLVVERTGMSAVIQHLTGIGSFWAQDPPYYAQVQSFQTGSEVDSSVTTLKDWRGWDHLRQIYFLHQGPVVILDRAEGPAHRQAALTWHLNGEATESEPGRLSLIHEENRNEILVIPLDGSLDPHDLRLSRDSEENLTHLAYQPQEGGSFAVLTIILSQDWFGASASIAQSSTGEHLVIEKPNQRIQLKLD